MSLGQAKSHGGPPYQHGLPDRFHLRVVAQIALAIGALTSAAMIFLVFVVKETPGTDYASLISAFDTTRENLAGAMLISGLILTTLAAFTTWLIVLYSSSRVAGPLYRLSRNLELVDTKGPVRVTAVRSGDVLQAEAADFERSVMRLRHLYHQLEQCVSDIERDLEAAESGHAVDATDTIAELHRHLRDIRF